MLCWRAPGCRVRARRARARGLPLRPPATRAHQGQPADGASTSLLSPHMHFGRIRSRKPYFEVRRMERLSAVAASANREGAGGAGGGGGAGARARPGAGGREEGWAGCGGDDSKHGEVPALAGQPREYSRYLASPSTSPSPTSAPSFSNLKFFP